MTEITVYSKLDCQACEEAIKLLQLRGMKFRIVKLETDIAISYFKAQFPTVRELPYILTDGQPIGNLKKLKEFLAK